MSQDKEEIQPLKKSDKAGERRVRPFDKVKVTFGESEFEPKERKEEIHPELARKLYEKGMITYDNASDMPGDLKEAKTAKKKKANKEDEV